MTQVNSIAVLPLGRPTFDVEFAEQQLASMLAALRATGRKLIGPECLLMDGDAAEAAIETVAAAEPDLVLVLQVTFTDAAVTARIAERFDTRLAIWAVPEPRLGGRLRLNAFCGLNLASHALGLRNRSFGWLYADPNASDIGERLAGLIAGDGEVKPDYGKPVAVDKTKGEQVLASVSGRRIGRLGDHPDGFDTCRYDADALKTLADISVEELPLQKLFSTAADVPAETVATLRTGVAQYLNGLDAVDQGELAKSLALKPAIEAIRDAGGFDAFAIRCWPETFTEYGGAVCGPVAMMGENRVPCACEADVYGAATQLFLQAVADAPVFLADLVDIDTEDDTAVVWHCGQAPLSMADPEAHPDATIHTNRRMPLLYEFALKPGRVTLMRLSQAFGKHKLVIASGEMLKRPMAFTGTSGVMRFDRPASQVLPAVFDSGLEHHMAIVYGDHGDALLSLAAQLDLPVLRL